MWSLCIRTDRRTIYYGIHKWHWLPVPVRQHVIYKTALITENSENKTTGLSTWLASLSSTSSYSEILQSTTTLSAGDKDQLPIQGSQYHGTSCLELSVSSYKKFRYHHHFQGTSENWTVHCCIRHGLTFLLQTAPPIWTLDIRCRQQMFFTFDILTLMSGLWTSHCVCQRVQTACHYTCEALGVVCCVFWHAGNWEGEGRFKMWFNHGGAIEFGQAMLHAGRLGEWAVIISCCNNL